MNSNIAKTRIDFKTNQLHDLRNSIRDVRKQLGTQKQVAEKIGFTQGHLSKLESGNHNAIPPTEYLQRLARIARLSYAEEALWIGMAGHLPWTYMPNANQVETVLNIYCEDIARDKFPSYIIDFRLMIWAMNSASYNATDFNTGIQILQHQTTLFDTLFNSSNFGESESALMDTLFDSSTIRNIQKIPIIIFNLLNMMRRHEPFYKMYPMYVEKRLKENPRDAHRFREAWDSIAQDTQNDDEYLSTLVRDYMGFGAWIKPFNFQGTSEQSFEFSHRVEKIVHMPQFAIVRLQPRDGNQELLSSLSNFTEKQSNKTPYLAIWQPEVSGREAVSSIISQYNHENLLE